MEDDEAHLSRDVVSDFSKITRLFVAEYFGASP